MSQCEKQHQLELDRVSAEARAHGYLQGVRECELKLVGQHELELDCLRMSHDKDNAYNSSALREITQAYDAAHAQVESLKGLLRSAETDVRRLRLQLERTGSDHLDAIAQRVANLEKQVAINHSADKGWAQPPEQSLGGYLHSKPSIGVRHRHPLDGG